MTELVENGATDIGDIEKVDVFERIGFCFFRIGYTVFGVIAKGCTDIG